MVQMNKTLEARESEITVQNNEIRKLTDLVHKTLEEGENQRNAVKGKLIDRINEPGPTENAI